MLEKWPTCDYFMFMEDDFVLCDKTMEAVSHALAKSSAYSPDWSALRISYGLNGLIVPCKDLAAMKDFMYEKSSWRPADLLAVYWVGKIAEEGAAHFGDRRVSVYRYNIMDHIGRVSTYPGRTLGQKVRSSALLKLCFLQKLCKVLAAFGVDVLRRRSDPLSCDPPLSMPVTTLYRG